MRRINPVWEFCPLPAAPGGGGDGETIATLFSFQTDIQNAFTVVPRTSAVNALVAEQNFQLSGYTDSDTISRLGALLNADFVVSGHIRRVGNRNLIITTIVNVETFEQLAGDYREYGRIEEVEAMLPEISRIIINASRSDSSLLPKLAVVPFNIANEGVNMQDAEALAQILAIELGNTNNYIILPRTTTIQAAMSELEYQMSGATADEGAKALGRAINAEYVLNAEVRSLGTTNMFTASILNVEDGSQLAGGYRSYQTITDGISLMKELALLLDPDSRGEVPPNMTAPFLTPPETAETQNESETKTAKTPAPARSKFWSLGASVGSSFSAPWIIATARGTLAPLPYSFLEIGIDFGFIGLFAHGYNYPVGRDVGYYSIYPHAHYAVFLPFKEKGGWYAGAGGGYMFGRYEFDFGETNISIPAFDVVTGFNIGDVFDISYTIRTNFESANHKLSLGFTYRFK